MKKYIFLVVLQLLLTGCADERMVHQGFMFDTRNDSPEPTLILDYQYGIGNQVGTHANRESVKMGKFFTQGFTFGYLPRADYLYVKWRIQQTGEVYEDRVDLKDRLPKNIEDCIVDFTPVDDKLYIYVIFPEQRSGQDSIGPIRGYENLRQLKIYPDIVK